MTDRKSPQSERELAWHAPLEVATRTPFLDMRPGLDPASLIAEAVYDSSAVHAALYKLATRLSPRSPLVPVLLPALMATRNLLSLRSSWIAYCNERFSLNPALEDVTTEMSRQYVPGDDVRAWPLYDEGRSALDEAVEAVRQLQPVLAQFSGIDPTVRVTAPGVLRRSALRAVADLRTAW